MNNLEIIKNAFWKAIPEIKELKFGCGIEIHKEVFKVCQYFEDVEEVELISSKRSLWSVAQLKQMVGVYFLGRDIRLADVLVALQKIDKVQKSHFAVNVHGIFYAFSGDWVDGSTAKVEYLNLGWNLKDDNLDHQSPECLELLANLLK